MKPASFPERRARGLRQRGLRQLGFTQRGFTLIDVLVVIVVTGITAGAIVTLAGRLAEQSADALRAREAHAVAQALLGEITRLPFTYCDAGDANVLTATAAVLGLTACATQVDQLGPEPGETRYNPANRYDGLTDYHGFTMPGPGCLAGLCDMAGVPVNPPGSTLAGCSATVTHAPTALPGIAALDANGRPQVLRITVRVACPNGRGAIAEAVRLRHAPNRI